MPNWSGRLFFFGMMAYLIYVIMIGDGPKWYALFTKKGNTLGGTISTKPGQYGATGSY